jgi:hypothetical protein
LPVAEIRLNGCSIAWHEIPLGWANWTMPIQIPKGKSSLTVFYANGPRWGGDRKLRLATVTVSQVGSFPSGFAELAGPGAIVTWKVGRSTVVIDNIDWQSAPDNGKREKRFMAALLQNLGLRFKMPSQQAVDAIPISVLSAYGGQYNTARDSGIELRSTGYVEGKFACEKSGPYELRLRARSTPALGQFAMAEVYIDGRLIDSITIDSLATKEFKFKAAVLTPGIHTLKIAFPNDASNEREDRNLFIDSVGFGVIG